MLRLEVRLGWRALRNLDLEIIPFHVSRVAAHACVHVARRRHHPANDQAVRVESVTSIRRVRDRRRAANLIAVAISWYDCQSRPDCAKLIENGVGTNISEVPYLVSVFSEFIHLLRQTIMRVREHENASRLFVRDRQFAISLTILFASRTERAPRPMLTKRASTATLD